MKKRLLRSQRKKLKDKNIKQYDPPHLIRYGTLKELTNAMGGGGPDAMLAMGIGGNS